MKTILLSLFTFIIFTSTFSQENKEEVKLYDDNVDPAKQLSEAIIKAKAENKNILLQVGGNWCIWCIRFNAFTNSDKEIDSLLNADFVVVHINYSKENKNLPFMKSLDYPQRFGFPVFVILNSEGQRIHTQNSAYLEAKETYYNKTLILEFLNAWSPSAFDPAKYEK